MPNLNSGVIQCECENIWHTDGSDRLHAYANENAYYEAVFPSVGTDSVEYAWNLCGSCVDSCHWQTMPELIEIRKTSTGEVITTGENQ